MLINNIFNSNDNWFILSFKYINMYNVWSSMSVINKSGLVKLTPFKFCHNYRFKRAAVSLVSPNAYKLSPLPLDLAARTPINDIIRYPSLINSNVPINQPVDFGSRISILPVVIALIADDKSKLVSCSALVFHSGCWNWVCSRTFHAL